MSNFFEWDARYNLGVKAMDDEHRLIIEAMNLLHELHEKRAPAPQLVKVMSQLVKVTRDNGRTWTDVSDFQRRGQIHSVEPSHTNAAEAYVTADARGDADYNPYVYRTRD